MSTQFRWAVLLCNCQGTKKDLAVAQYFVELFTPGLGGAIDYWADISYGELDLAQSVVYDWVQLPITLQQALTTRRSDAIAMGMVAHKEAGHQLEGFNAVLVYIDVPFIGQNINEGGQQGGGSSGGNVLIDRGAKRPTFIFHEMGHGHGLDHSYDVQGAAYMDPYCIMSAELWGGAAPTFIDPRFGLSGPSLCSPYALAKRWLPELNVIRVASNGRRPDPTRLVLPPFERVATVRPQVAVIDFTQPFQTRYFIDYHWTGAWGSGGWDRGLAQDAVVVRQYRPDGRSYFAGKIATSVGSVGGKTLLAEQVYIDSQFDLSVTVHSVANGQVDMTIAPAAAVQSLSERRIAHDKLGLNGGFSTRGSILIARTNSLRKSLVDILGR